jgi:hypothetical protein
MFRHWGDRWGGGYDGGDGLGGGGMMEETKGEVLAEFPEFAVLNADAETQEKPGFCSVILKLEDIELDCLYLDSNGYLLTLRHCSREIHNSGFCPSVEVAAFSLRRNAGKDHKATAEAISEKQAHLQVLELIVGKVDGVAGCEDLPASYYQRFGWRPGAGAL